MSNDRNDRLMRSLARMDAGNLREWTVETLVEGIPDPCLGYAIDRLASLRGGLAQVLRDLAADVEAYRQTYDEFMRGMLTTYPKAQADTDDDGQLIIYTGLHSVLGHVVPFKPPVMDEPQ